ncbi:ornithine carbamoyltransferase [Sulfurospirillum arcachonense]|uniref:ornithine carbamoyltransferase n=1 Tax=Sulfurospirillum arcachonense TaxID=57666 RepID=UPI000468CAE8|nr:ornithine carbamoyltransferase [Sulfurospirillum arcachonense]
MKHFLSIYDHSKEDILEIIELASKIKKEAKVKNYIPYLQNQSLGMLFEKSSTRTRISFEVGIHQLGGQGLFLSSNDLQLGRGESMKDSARVMGRMIDMIMIRTFDQKVLDEFAKYSGVPVINGLTDKYHPVQLMADYLTMKEHGKTDNPIVAYIGDGNNMTHSWMMLAGKLGFELRIATPKGYEPWQEIIDDANELAKISGAKITYTNDPKVAVNGADVVTTDTWISMGQEEEKEERVKAFDGYMVDRDLMSLAKNDAIFLHCLPAYRGYEVSDEVFESHANVVFDEAENRLHAQKGIMVWLNAQKDK